MGRGGICVLPVSLEGRKRQAWIELFFKIACSDKMSNLPGWQSVVVVTCLCHSFKFMSFNGSAFYRVRKVIRAKAND